MSLLILLLEAQTYHNFYRSGTNRSRFLFVFNALWYFVHQRLLVPFGLGVLLSCMFPVWTGATHSFFSLAAHLITVADVALVNALKSDDFEILKVVLSYIAANI